MEGTDKRFFWSLLILIVLLSVVYLYLRLFLNNNDQFRIIFFNIGQGDASLIEFSNGERMLVDCGPDKKVLSKLGKYLPFFDRRLDYLLITHPDSDHYAGCPAVLSRYQVKNIFLNGAQKPGDPFWEAWKKTRMLEGANEKIINGFETLEIGDGRLVFLSPDNNLRLVGVDNNDTNNFSIVFNLKHGDKKYLFTGDMEAPLENTLLEKYCPNRTDLTCEYLQADYLKVGHHGSDSSSGVDFLKVVNPKFAIISVGPAPNRYGHPSLRTLRKLERASAVIWRTDQLDDIIVK